MENKKTATGTPKSRKDGKMTEQKKIEEKLRELIGRLRADNQAGILRMTASQKATMLAATEEINLLIQQGETK